MDRFRDLAEGHLQSIGEVLQANEDLARRLLSLSVTVCYDREDDTLFVTLGDPQEAITESMGNRMYLRLDPDTLHIVGVEIPHVSARIHDDELLAGFLRRFFPMATPEPQLAAELAGWLRELVEARA